MVIEALPFPGGQQKGLENSFPGSVIFSRACGIDSNNFGVIELKKN